MSFHSSFSIQTHLPVWSFFTSSFSNSFMYRSMRSGSSIRSCCITPLGSLNFLNNTGMSENLLRPKDLRLLHFVKAIRRLPKGARWCQGEGSIADRMQPVIAYSQDYPRETRHAAIRVPLRRMRAGFRGAAIAEFQSGRYGVPLLQPEEGGPEDVGSVNAHQKPDQEAQDFGHQGRARDEEGPGSPEQAAAGLGQTGRHHTQR